MYIININFFTDFNFLYDQELINISNSIHFFPKTKEDFFKDFPNNVTKVYANAKIEHKNILSDNKNKSGIYLWYNSKTKKYYIPAAHWTLKPTGWGGNLKT